ncbi:MULTISPECIES: hypothetical protein [Bacillus]|uniref:Uncharacterized protein n=1 Tax=Bacillus mycoides TaxID=1405 RepID=A0A3D9VK63_BACMY|nr:MULTISPECIES: hypothetical protein [Bacillus]RBP27277.1 hypothetical protein DET63_10696 [Bacillus sp. DB-2]REF39535.1 hypothetical protein DET55_105148 [Bacillus mycoides]
MDQESVILKEISDYEFIEIVQNVAEHHLEDKYFDKDIKNQYGPSIEKSLLMFAWTKGF